jgi:hypothetical protein
VPEVSRSGGPKTFYVFAATGSRHKFVLSAAQAEKMIELPSCAQSREFQYNMCIHF